MSEGPDRALSAAAAAFATAALFGSAVAARDDLPGQPLHLSIPVSTRVGLLAGWGAGVAAPWPLPVTALVAAALARRGARDGGPTIGAGAVCAWIGTACIAGTLIEPVTYRPTPAARVAIALNVAASVGLCVAGLRHIARERKLGQDISTSLPH